MPSWTAKVDESTCGTLVGFWLTLLATHTSTVNRFVVTKPRRVLPGEEVSFSWICSVESCLLVAVTAKVKRVDNAFIHKVLVDV